jgi:hypothetical protein
MKIKVAEQHTDFLEMSSGLGPWRSKLFFLLNMQLSCKNCISVSAQYWLNNKALFYNKERAPNTYISLIMRISSWNKRIVKISEILNSLSVNSICAPLPK